MSYSRSLCTRSKLSQDDDYSSKSIARGSYEVRHVFQLRPHAEHTSTRMKKKKKKKTKVYSESGRGCLGRFHQIVTTRRRGDQSFISSSSYTTLCLGYERRSFTREHGISFNSIMFLIDLEFLRISISEFRTMALGLDFHWTRKARGPMNDSHHFVRPAVKQAW